MKKSKYMNLFLCIVFLMGLSLLLYPAASDYWNSFHQSQMVASYIKEVTRMDNELYEQVKQDAEAYNQTLIGEEDRFILDEEEQKTYKGLINLTGNGIMGYLEIPSIHVSMAVYHGTEDTVLQIAAGHLAGTSLPIGGESTHCVISGHRGLPSARLFTDLDKLEEGDEFILHVLDESLVYVVDQIRIISPHELDDLKIEKGKDYCTLLTCTPYGINTHRLLVRGHRGENLIAENTIRVTADAALLDPVMTMPLIAIPILVVLLILLIIPKRGRRYYEGGDDDADEDF